MSAALAPRRATLFIGALALDPLPAALASGADLLCIDLEDAVPPGRKDDGRAAALEALAALAPRALPCALVARINPLSTPEGQEDLRCLLPAATPLAALMLPKVESAAEVLAAAEALDAAQRACDLFVIIETPAALEHAVQIAQAHPRLKALYFGGFDLSTALGCEMAWEPLLYARSRVVHAAASGGLDCIDSPYPILKDAAGLSEACVRARALGMTGKTAKSASQVPSIVQAFTPSEAELARARRIVAEFERDPTRPLYFEGRLIERPAIKRLQKLLALA